MVLALEQRLGGDLVSIETEEEWNFINDEIQRRNTTNYDNKKKKGRELELGEWKDADYLQMGKRVFANGEKGSQGVNTRGPSYTGSSIMANGACLVVIIVQF